MNKTVGIVLFERFHQRKGIGSSRIRGRWLLKYMPEAEEFVQGKNYETIIFQKVYWKEMAREFKGKKILDICDPDWLDGIDIVSFAKEMDAITVPTEKMKETLEKMTDKPVFIIPDRIDFDTLNPPKKHEGRAKKVVWFGYSHNCDVLNQTLYKIKKNGLILKVISEGNYATNECRVENVKWNEETVNSEIQNADFALLPEKLSGRWEFKSQNKTHQCWVLGIPVAKTLKELERFMDGEERQKETNEKYKWAMENFNVKKSVDQLREVIKSIKK